MKQALEGKDIILLVESGLKTKEDLGERCMSPSSDASTLWLSRGSLARPKKRLTSAVTVSFASDVNTHIGVVSPNCREISERPLLHKDCSIYPAKKRATQNMANDLTRSCVPLNPHPKCAERSMPLPVAPLFESTDRVKAAGISCVVVGEALIRGEDAAKAAEALLL